MAKKNTSSATKKSVKKSSPAKTKKITKKPISKKSVPVKKKAESKKIITKKSKPAPKPGVSKKTAVKNRKASSSIPSKGKVSTTTSQKQIVSVKNKSNSKKASFEKYATSPASNKKVAEKSKLITSGSTTSKKTPSALKGNSNASNKKVDSAVNTAPAALPKGAFELEYVVHASAELLFTFLTEPSGLSEWFCDDVNIRNGIYTFFWDGTSQQAREVKVIQDKVLRLQWLDKADGTYFEYRIEKDDLTSDISLIITDFADSPDEKQSSVLLWNSQIDKLLHVMGAYF